MKATEQTLQQIGRAIHIRVTQETGELTAFDDDDNEITRCVVEQWIDNKDDDFYEQIASIIRRVIDKQKAQVENMGLLKPYAFVLEDDDKEPAGELYVVDDDTVIIDTELMADLDKDLDDFFDKLLKEAYLFTDRQSLRHTSTGPRRHARHRPSRYTDERQGASC